MKARVGAPGLGFLLRAETSLPGEDCAAIRVYYPVIYTVMETSGVKRHISIKILLARDICARATRPQISCRPISPLAARQSGFSAELREKFVPPN